MLTSLHRVSAFYFYLLAILALGGVVLLHRSGTPASFIPVVNALDLPLILAAMLYAGTGLYSGLVQKGMHSRMLMVVITVPLVLLFAFFLYLNFFFPVTLPSVQ